MRRSEIQSAIAQAKQTLDRYSFKLPVFADWSIEEWKEHAQDIQTIRDTMRGWDVTDFGCGDFSNYGAVLFTIRNGTPDGKKGCPYAEKIIVMAQGQKLPLHYHAMKTEDIINRNGGVLAIQVFNSLPNGRVDVNGDVLVLMDGMQQTVAAGTWVKILPGGSMTIYPGLYHCFLVEEAHERLIIGEVSSINDDTIDNYFAESNERFSEVIEDAPWTIPLVNEYARLFR